MNLPLEPGVSVKGQVTTVELSRHERSVARRSAETRATVPSVELACDVDMGPCERTARTQSCPPLAVMLAIVSQQLRELPRLNGAYRDGGYELYGAVNLGISLPGPDGHVLATLFEAGTRSPGEIAAELDDLSTRAAIGRLSPGELSGSTFTVMPPGPEGVTWLTPLIHGAQAAALAIGAIREVAVVRDGQIRAGRGATLTLACDHRIVSPGHGADFLAALKTALEALTG